MRNNTVQLCLLLALLIGSAVEISAQPCSPGYGGPQSILMNLPVDGYPRGCQFTVWYCQKTWNDGMVTRYAYHFWFETPCKLNSGDETEIAEIYRLISENLAQINPAEFQYYMCDVSGDDEQLIDVSHASCAWEKIIVSPDTSIPNTYQYIGCPGSGKCYQRYSVCEICANGAYQNPITLQWLCAPTPPGVKNTVRVTPRQSWTTGDCTNIVTPDGNERPCVPTCGSDAPGPDVGMKR